ncbi:uncharacterized protein Asalp_19410 [Aeromonas salmonicida subsp. pectinolytica 34mel]|uniref:Uncharacterized protein n=1 Tax=Aeromonas salmonicida subsp. pectinolytica 34mel TaxID=1324960 RepID=A0A2D1QFZ8_AERSA|nr:uncharacterized protein Asalp_19410 [Aeromonas salmonicida subsp. pectinolytica 34mel]
MFRNGRAIAQELAQGRSLGRRQGGRQLGKMHVFRVNALYLYSALYSTRRCHLCKALQQFLDTKLRQCRRTSQDFHMTFLTKF